MSHPLPFGVARDHALKCKIGDWVPTESAPEWGDSTANQSVRPSGGQRLAKPWLFIPVIHVNPGGEETVWKRVL